MKPRTDASTTRLASPSPRLVRARLCNGGVSLTHVTHVQDAVSTDFVGARSTGVIDAPATICKGKRCNLYVWYDNEFGYACQVIRLLQQITGVVFHTFPPMRITS